jgi:CDP-glucose 4,6-dehydratase
MWLYDLGAKITGYALPPHTTPSNFVAAGAAGLLAGHHESDVRDLATLQAAVQVAQPDVIFHLAAQPIVRTSYANPRETFEINVMRTVNLLEAVRALAKPCNVVVITSDKCYENREQLWGYREIDALGGYDPYSASKGAVEIVAASYRRSYDMKIATVRAGNVIGGGDWSKDRIIPDIVRHLHANQPIPVRNPQAIRPWQHVLEPLYGYLMLATRMLQSDDATWCDAWNFGPVTGEELPVGELVKLFVAAWGDGSWIDASDAQAPHEDSILRLCVDKARHHIGWRPRWSAAEAIQRTAAWFRRFYTCVAPDTRTICREDIDAYVRA